MIKCPSRPLLQLAESQQYQYLFPSLIMEAVAFLAYYDARWVFELRLKQATLCLAVAFQTGILLWTVWGYNAGVDMWWCILRISACLIVLCQLFGLVLDDVRESLAKKLFACGLSYFTLIWAGKDSRLATLPITFTSTLAALTRTYATVFLLVVAIALIGLLIKVCWVLLSLTKPRLHLRLHGYRDS